MGTVSIHYFSGSGNSLLVARKLALTLGGAPLLHMAAAEGGRVSGEYEAIGLVFPVYNYSLPEIVADYVARSDFGEAGYRFAIATNGGDAGNALYQLDELLRAKGLRLNLGMAIPMGDNSIILKTASVTLAERMVALGPSIEAFSAAVARREDLPSGYNRRLGAAALGKFYDFAFARYYHSDRGRADPAKCSACGTCARLCPVANIRIEGGRAMWGDRCASCFGCVNLCPRNAVSLGRIHPKDERAQYRCPGIGAADLFRT